MLQTKLLEISNKSDLEMQIVEDILRFSDLGREDWLVNHQNCYQFLKEHILPALISVLLSSLYLNNNQQRNYYELIKEQFYSKFQQMKQKLGLIEPIKEQNYTSLASIGNKINQVPQQKYNPSLFSFGDAIQLDKLSPEVKQKSLGQSGQLNSLKDMNEQEELASITNIPYAREYYEKMLAFFQSSLEFFEEFQNSLYRKIIEDMKPITFSKISTENEIESEILLNQIFQQYPNKFQYLICLFYDELLKFNFESLIDHVASPLSELKYSLQDIKTKIDTILQVIQESKMKLEKLALKLTLVKIKSVVENRMNLDTESLNFQKLLFQPAFQTFLLPLQPLNQIELLVFKDATLIYRELLINKSITIHLQQQEQFFEILDQITTTKESELFASQINFYYYQQQNKLKILFHFKNKANVLQISTKHFPNKCQKIHKINKYALFLMMLNPLFQFNNNKQMYNKSKLSLVNYKPFKLLPLSKFINQQIKRKIQVVHAKYSDNQQQTVLSIFLIILQINTFIKYQQKSCLPQISNIINPHINQLEQPPPSLIIASYHQNFVFNIEIKEDS